MGGSPMALDGTATEGPYATLRASLDGDDWILLAHRGAQDSALLGLCATERETDGFRWYDLRRPAEGRPPWPGAGAGGWSWR